MSTRSFTVPDILDAQGRPVGGARVVAKRCDTHAYITEQFTDANGNTTFTTLPLVDVYFHATWGGLAGTGKERWFFSRIIDVEEGGTGATTAAEACSNLGVGTEDSPQFTAVNIGHPSDTTLARSAAGRATIEGKGVVRAPASSTTNQLARYDGTTGDKVQTSSVIIDDSDNVSGVAKLTTSGDIELGHASDTTIHRVSAALIAVEGDNLIRASDVDDTPVNGQTAVPVSSNWAYDHKVQMIDGPLSPMILSGGGITEGTTGTVTIAALTALLRTDTGAADPLTYITLAEQANKTMASAATKYLVVLDYNSGTPQILIQEGAATGTTQIMIGICMKDSSDNVHFEVAGYRLQDGVAKLHTRAHDLRTTELASGCTITDEGGASRQFNIVKGITYHGIHKLTPFSVSGTFDSGTDKFTYIHGDSTAGFTYTADSTVINNTQYWDAVGHALALVTVNKYGCHWVYLHPDEEHIFVLLGNSNSKLAEAELEQEPTDKPIEITDFGVLLGCIIIERNDTAFTLVQMVTDKFFTGTAVASHTALEDLGSDDHPQYILYSLATAANDFLVGYEAGLFIKQTLAQVRTLLDWTTDIGTHAALTTGIHGVGAGSVVGTALAQTITNKRNQPRISSSASGHMSPSVATADIYIRTAQAAAITINNPAGTPVQGEKLIVRLKDNGTGRAITFGNQYRALEFALPTTTVISKTMYLGFIFNSTDTKWDMVAINEEA